MSRSIALTAFSRRSFLEGFGAAVIVQCAFGTANAYGEKAKSNRVRAYVGTYTGAIGAGSNGEGIYLFSMNSETGELSGGKLVAKTPNPSWIVIHPSADYLYAVNEIDNYRGKSGSVSAFSIDKTSGELHALNVVSSEGAGPAYISINSTGTLAFVANYGGGSIAILPIHADGSLGPATDVHRDSGSIGAEQASNAPVGSFAVSGHDGAHAHMIVPDPQNKYVLATDLGQDRIYTYQLDTTTQKLTQVSTFQASPGDGPRHLAFHPNGRWLYSIQEESSTILFFRYEPSTGSIHMQQSVSALPPGFTGSSFASEILVHPNGKFIYAANRLHDAISVFLIDSQGKLTYAGESSSLGDYPGQCSIDPSGTFLYACNRRSDNITSFRIEPADGLLHFSGQYVAVGSPASITFWARC